MFAAYLFIFSCIQLILHSLGFISPFRILTNQQADGIIKVLCWLFIMLTKWNVCRKGKKEERKANLNLMPMSSLSTIFTALRLNPKRLEPALRAALLAMPDVPPIPYVEILQCSRCDGRKTWLRNRNSSEKGWRHVFIICTYSRKEER